MAKQPLKLTGDDGSPKGQDAASQQTLVLTTQYNMVMELVMIRSLAESALQAAGEAQYHAIAAQSPGSKLTLPGHVGPSMHEAATQMSREAGARVPLLVTEVVRHAVRMANLLGITIDEAKPKPTGPDGDARYDAETKPRG